MIDKARRQIGKLLLFLLLFPGPIKFLRGRGLCFEHDSRRAQLFAEKGVELKMGERKREWNCA